MSIRFASRLENFAFAPASPRPAVALRLGLAVTLLAQAAQMAHHFFDFYGAEGLLQGPLSAFFSSGPVTGMAFIARLSDFFGIGDTVMLLTLGAVYVVALALLLVGAWTRVAAIVVFATHWCLAGGQLTSYGFDSFAHIGLFYLMLMPAGAMFSVDHWRGMVSQNPCASARFSLRCLQIHLSIAYFAAGIEKALGVQWWNGDAIWRTLMLPLFRQFDFSWLASFPWLATALGWATIAVEVGYPFFIWPRRTRYVWCAATVALHIGIGVFMGLTLFAVIMCVLTLSAFAVSAEPSAMIQAENGKGILLRMGCPAGI